MLENWERTFQMYLSFILICVVFIWKLSSQNCGCAASEVESIPS